MKLRIIILLGLIFIVACAQPPVETDVQITIAFVTAMAQQAGSEPVVTPQPPTPIPTAELAAESSVVMVLANTAYIRSGPGMNYEPLSWASRGQTFTVLDRWGNNDWFMIALEDGVAGWIGGSVVSFQPLNRSGTIDIDPPAQEPPQVVNTPQPPPPPTSVPSQDGCCMYCTKGQACGDACINREYDCNKGRGCACNASIDSGQSVLFAEVGVPISLLAGMSK